MVGNRDFQRALEDGRRNQEVKVLIQNWCGHARIEKFGGTGMIEQMTGFPIGNHSMGCEQHLAKGAVPEALECSGKWHGVLREIQESRGNQ